MVDIQELVHNYVLNVSLLAWLTAQILKTLYTYITTKKLQLERLVGAGGMPSAHSATVCALFIAIARKVGFTSPLFAVAFVLAVVVMYDAMGVRRAAGEQAKVLNKIVQERNVEDEDDESPTDTPLKEFLGHTPLQVLGGALLGILIAIVIPVS